MFHTKLFWLLTCLAIFAWVISACAPTQAPQPTSTVAQPTPMELEPLSLGPGEKLKVVATTNLIADMVSQVGGDQIELTGLLPVGADPHTFSPTPRDVSAVADAQVVFVNGLGLEEFLEEMLKNAGGEAPVIALSLGVETRELGESEGHEQESEGDEYQEEGHYHEGVDPHTWTTPVNGIVFVQNIEHALSALDPGNAEIYKTNAEAYQAQLKALDEWITAQVETIPAEDRELVTDHDAFGYYVDRYGLKVIGAVIPAYSTNAQPSAQELAELQNAINKFDVKAVFVGTTINPILSERVAEDTGIQLVPLFTGSLGEPGSGVESYIDYICYNTTAIVEALGGTIDVAGSPCE
jgi:ABC-type Zn uptake system ZnuABC Zn-binding protein ZnuA